MRILFAEDDKDLGEAVQQALTEYGYTVDLIKDGKSAQHALLNQHFDTLILDLGLPKRSGLDVLKSIRARNITIPVIILTAREGIQDRVEVLDSGADDYMVKPFDLHELNARIRAVQRRTAERAKPVLSYGPIMLDPAAHTVTIDGKLINASRREFTLLQKLLENIGRVVSRDKLMQTLYGWGDDIDSNTLEVHIHNVRKKFGDTLPIQTIRGVGYMIRKESQG